MVKEDYQPSNSLPNLKAFEQIARGEKPSALEKGTSEFGLVAYANRPRPKQNNGNYESKK